MDGQVYSSVAVRAKSRAKHTVRVFLWIFEHWLLVFTTLFGAFIVAPFLAPVFMRLGWSGAAEVIYGIYSNFCHQMAQRCFFMFGPQQMYNIAQLPLNLSGRDMNADMLTVRAFIGTPDLGWKVAWSDRMVYMYSAVWLAGLVYGFVRRRRRVWPLGFLGFGLLLLPMVVDGGTHMLSDMINGLATGFRYDNAWLATLTANKLPHWFYYGDAFGSFNSWMRLVSGLLFGIAIVWVAFPHIDESLQEAARTLRAKLERAAAREVSVQPTTL